MRAMLMALALVSSRVEGGDIAVPAGGDLQSALNAARPGDTILLTAGATYVGNFILPVHGGTSYVTVRTGGNDAMLPGASARITPAHAPYLAKLRSPNGMAALKTAPGAAYWRIQLVEFLANQNGANDIVQLGSGSSSQNSLTLVPHHLVIDRVYMHGDLLLGQKRGIALNSGDTTIINSHIVEMKGIGQDTQAIAGWNGPGPYRIENNHLEAAGEVVIFGGDDPKIPGLIPSDVVIRGNVLTRPTSWREPIVASPTGVSAASAAGGTLAAGTYAYRVTARRPAGSSMATSVRSVEVSAALTKTGSVRISWSPVAHATEYRVYGRTPAGQSMYWTVSSTSFTDTGAAGTAGTPPSTGTVWLVKNLFELKNARRTRIEHNLMENNWSQAQTGIAVLFTPRNQYGGCPQCVVEDVTFEYNVVRNVGGGINILGRDYNHDSQQTNNIRVRNNIFSGIDRTLWGGSGYFLTVTRSPRDVVIDHNTIVSPNGLGVISVGEGPVIAFVFTNNVARHNSYGIMGTGQGYGEGAISVYFPDAVIQRNVLAGGKASMYPADNLFPATTEFEAHFVDYAGGAFALKPGTDWAGAGTDGRDLGAQASGTVVTSRPPPATSTPVPPAPEIAAVQMVTTTLAEATAITPYSQRLEATGGLGAYTWSVTAGAPPAGIALAATGELAGVPRTSGSATFTVTVFDSQNLDRRASRTFALQVLPAANAVPTVTLRGPEADALPVGAPLTLTAAASDRDGKVTRVDFFINGAHAGSRSTAPYAIQWTPMHEGAYTATAVATDDRGATGTSGGVTLHASAEVVIYAAGVARVVGEYQLVDDTSAAAGRRLWNPNRGAAKIRTAAAQPRHFAEFSFYAEAGRPYRIWIRGSSERNKWGNDSTFLQFSGAVDAAGAPMARIGTSTALWWSLEEYPHAGVKGWGWQDNGYGQNVDGAPIYFAATGLQTLRIQPREDGLSIDQIVISPARYFALPPGLPKQDATIVTQPYSRE